MGSLSSVPASRKRDDFPVRVRDGLSRRVALRCSNPNCRQVTSGPHDDDPGRATSIGVAAHITAACEGGPRYDDTLTPRQRAAAHNGIWLCQNCAKMIDSDILRFSEPLLREWKRKAELAARTEVERPHRLRQPEAPSSDTGIAPILTFEGTARYVAGPQNYGSIVAEGILRNIGSRPAMEATFFLGAGRPIAIDPLGASEMRSIRCGVPIGAPSRAHLPIKLVLTYQDASGATGTTDLFGHLDDGRPLSNVTAPPKVIDAERQQRMIHVRREILDRIQRHLHELRPLLFRGVIDVGKWRAANALLIERAYAVDVNEAIAQHWRAVMDALHNETTNVGVQETYYRDYSARMTDSNGQRAYNADEINNEYNELTRQVLADTILGYCDVVATLGDQRFAEEYRGAATQFRESAQRNLTRMRSAY